MSIQNAVDSALRTGAIVATQSAKGKELTQKKLQKELGKVQQMRANLEAHMNILQTKSYNEKGIAGAPNKTAFTIKGGKNGDPLYYFHQAGLKRLIEKEEALKTLTGKGDKE